MADSNVIMLSASIITSGVGWILFMYLRNMRQKVRTHILRNDEVKQFFVRGR